MFSVVVPKMVARCCNAYPCRPWEVWFSFLLFWIARVSVVAICDASSIGVSFFILWVKRSLCGCLEPSCGWDVEFMCPIVFIGWDLVPSRALGPQLVQVSGGLIIVARQTSGATGTRLKSWGPSKM